ncbi:putative cytochrome P450 monooxygenase [Viridothelium virens]|uniref:Putative cytochrome P450 monooxygenase n=1 Tax=Viridothelium virens TaxID=1048519 RepID=A0A6A6H529_VIRVR|nr:putative cytochrome P450 monooxygenase [Viridothelium virens]
MEIRSFGYAYDAAFYWMLVLCLSFGCYAVALFVYRLAIHPLARYPGPVLGRVTDWYSVYHAVKGDRYQDLHRLHSIYGNVVRFGPNRISIADPEALKPIYGINANTQKSQFYSVFKHFFGASSTQTTINKIDHAQRRKVLSRLLSEKSLRDAENAVHDNFTRFCSQLGVPTDSEILQSNGNACSDAACWSPPRDIERLLSYLTFDIMGDICFGRNLGTLTSDQNRDLISILPEGAQGLLAVAHMPGMLKLRLENVLFPKLMAGLEKYKSCSKELTEICMREHACAAITKPSVMHSILDETDGIYRTKDGEVSTSALVSEASLLIVAGSDTTSTALANTIFHLLNNPKTLSALSSEIRDQFQHVDEIAPGKKLAECSYLRACIDESLRLSPPVPSLMSREVLPGGLQIGGNFFPAGTDVGVPHYTAHHSPSIFQNPYKFDPGRWRSGGATSEGSLSDLRSLQSAFCAFSLGPRDCIGKRMAYMEMTTILARLVWLFEMRLASTDYVESKEIQGRSDNSVHLQSSSIDVETELRKRDSATVDKFVSKVQGPWVQFRKRPRRLNPLDGQSKTTKGGLA